MAHCSQKSAFVNHLLRCLHPKIHHLRPIAAEDIVILSELSWPHRFRSHRNLTSLPSHQLLHLSPDTHFLAIADDQRAIITSKKTKTRNEN